MSNLFLDQVRNIFQYVVCWKFYPECYLLFLLAFDTLSFYHTCPKFEKKKSLLPIDVSEIAGWVANCVDPDQTPQNVASDLGLRCLLKPVYLNTKVNYAVHFTAVLKSGVSLGKFNRRQINDIFSYFFFLENRLWNFMHNLHEGSRLIFWCIIRKVFQNVVCWIFYPEC